MTPEYNMERLQTEISYHFSNPEILERALTRRSYILEEQSSLDDSMDPLATLGDAVLDLIVIQRLYENGVRDEGILTENKKEVIDKAKTRVLAEKMDYENYVRWGNGEYGDKIWKSGDDTFDTCIEALIGAVYLDAQQNGKNGIVILCEMLTSIGFSLP